MKVNEKVTVGMVNDAPKYVIWCGRNHTVTQVGFHHLFREGKTLYHVFSISTQTLFMKLILDSETLSWKLEETSDGI